MKERWVTLAMPGGLHARAALRLVRAAGAFAAHLTLEYASHVAKVASPLALLTLAVPLGARVHLVADGPDEQAALEALVAVLEGQSSSKLSTDGLGERPEAEMPPTWPHGGQRDVDAASLEPPPPSATLFRGRGASMGAAHGTAHILRAFIGVAGVLAARLPEDEHTRLQRALVQVRSELSIQTATLSPHAPDELREMFHALTALAQDAAWEEALARALRPAHRAEDAVGVALEQWCAPRHGAGVGPAGCYDEALDDIAWRLQRALEGERGRGGGPLGGARVLIARRILPADLFDTNVGEVIAAVSVEGSAASHAGLVARARALPLVVGVEPAILDAAFEEAEAWVDGASGLVHLIPAAPVSSQSRLGSR